MSDDHGRGDGVGGRRLFEEVGVSRFAAQLAHEFDEIVRARKGQVRRLSDVLPHAASALRDEMDPEIGIAALEVLRNVEITQLGSEFLVGGLAHPDIAPSNIHDGFPLANLEPSFTPTLGDRIILQIGFAETKAVTIVFHEEPGFFVRHDRTVWKLDGLGRFLRSRCAADVVTASTPCRAADGIVNLDIDVDYQQEACTLSLKDRLTIRVATS